MKYVEGSNDRGALRARSAKHAQRVGPILAGLCVVSALMWGGARDSHADAVANGGSDSGAGTPSFGGGGTLINISDGFENGSQWGFFSSNGAHGNGYVSNRPADAISPTHVGDIYDGRDAAPGYQVLSKTFSLASPGKSCWAQAAIKPLSDIGGLFELRDGSTREVLSSVPIQMQAGTGWKWVTTNIGPSTASNSLTVRVVLLDNGTWQELLVDSFSASCSP